MAKVYIYVSIFLKDLSAIYINYHNSMEFIRVSTNNNL